ncbi:hypothetical protein H6G27_24235 [Nostoc linckia FACHB-104]|nr:hypothetical protein [Nostoc linckia FACHB-104]
MSDAISRLKQKAQERPKVPPREKSIINGATAQSLNDEKTEFSHLENTEVLNDESKPPAQEEESTLVETVRRTIRLEQGIDTQLEAFCQRHKVTRETFLEAAFVLGMHNEELLKEIVNEAKERYQQRKKTGEQRKFQTMAKRIGK